MAAIVAAYGLLSYGVLASTSFLYQLLNLTGAITLIISSYYKRAWPIVVLNIFWALIALIAIFRSLFQ